MRSRMFDKVSKTWNPITGCLHYCKYCWARNFAETRLKFTEKYKKGFVPQIHEKEFKRGFNGGFVFVSDMGDLFGSWVPRSWILKVIEHIKKYPKTTFLFLTKNPKRYHEFVDVLPNNVVLGATIETNKDDLYLSHRISRAPLPSERFEAMRTLEWPYKLVSVEPILDFDLEEFTTWIKEIGPLITYIGYDNYGHRLPEPSLSKTKALMQNLAKFTEVRPKTLRERALTLNMNEKEFKEVLEEFREYCKERYKTSSVVTLISGVRRLYEFGLLFKDEETLKRELMRRGFFSHYYIEAYRRFNEFLSSRMKNIEEGGEHGYNVQE